jgi:glyceraldehyde 3-phosphate dehydrogenase
MTKIRVAINGFGRIGRTVFKVLAERDNIEVVALNDLTDPKTLAHLLKYDSVHRKSSLTIASDDKNIIVNGVSIPVYAEKDPELLPWAALQVDVVIESTGLFLDTEKANKHIKAGAKKVVISAPPKDETKSIVLGVNHKTLSATDVIVSNASCTTNCAAPMIKVLDDIWGIENGEVSTIHSYTGDQNLHDAPHKDLRRARAAAVSIIPTTTGAAKALTKIFPHLEGKLGGCGIRVPVPDGSLTDCTVLLKKAATEDEIKAAFKAAANGELKGIVEYTDEPLVSIDIVGNPHSVIFDSELTSVKGRMVKIIGWYDNEMGYSHRLADLVTYWFSLK